MACLREWASPKAELRAALNADVISMRNTNNQFRDLMNLVHEHDPSAGGRMVKIGSRKNEEFRNSNSPSSIITLVPSGQRSSSCSVSLSITPLVIAPFWSLSSSLLALGFLYAITISMDHMLPLDFLTVTQ